MCLPRFHNTWTNIVFIVLGGIGFLHAQQQQVSAMQISYVNALYMCIHTCEYTCIKEFTGADAHTCIHANLHAHTCIHADSHTQT
jgi:hypothetical protein